MHLALRVRRRPDLDRQRRRPQADGVSRSSSSSTTPGTPRPGRPRACTTTRGLGRAAVRRAARGRDRGHHRDVHAVQRPPQAGDAGAGDVQPRGTTARRRRWWPTARALADAGRGALRAAARRRRRTRSIQLVLYPVKACANGGERALRDGRRQPPLRRAGTERRRTTWPSARGSCSEGRGPLARVQRRRSRAASGAT